MHSSVYFAVISMVLVGAADFLYKRAAVAGAAPSTFLMVQSWFFGATALAFGLVTHALRFRPALLLGPLAALVIFVGSRTFYQSLRGGEASVSTPIFRLGFVVTVALSVLFLGEHLSARKVAGFVLAGASILLLAGFPLVRLLQGRLRGAFGRPLLLALAAMGCMGLLNFIYALGARLGATGPSLILSQFCAFTIIAFCHAHWWDGGVRLSRAAWVHAPLAGICLSSGFITLIIAIQRGEASVAVPISQMSFVVTTVLAALVYHESFTARKVVGLVASALTILVLNR
jgi:uncharacterized membrane protein